MGIHSPFGYVGYEVQFAEILTDILDKLCAGCHTSNDFWKGCQECPAGNLALECRRYILNAMEQDYFPSCELLRAMKKKIKRLKPKPFFYRGTPHRPKVLADFAELTAKYKALLEAQRQKRLGPLRKEAARPFLGEEEKP